jgi:hypothetical protein
VTLSLVNFSCWYMVWLSPWISLFLHPWYSSLLGSFSYWYSGVALSLVHLSCWYSGAALLWISLLLGIGCGPLLSSLLSYRYLIVASITLMLSLLQCWCHMLLPLSSFFHLLHPLGFDEAALKMLPNSSYCCRSLIFLDIFF